MPEQIVIEGNIVKTLEVTVLSEARLEDLLPRIEYRPPIFLGMLPKNAKVAYWDESDPNNKRLMLLAEMMPGVRSLRYDRRRYTLSLPWTYFLFEFSCGSRDPLAVGAWGPSNTRVFWAREEVTGLDSMLGRALTPNCSPEGSICFGDTGVPANLPIGTRVERTMHEFYLTTFMHDSGTGSPWGSETGSTTWARWHTESENDPHAWQRFPEWNLSSDEGHHPAIGPMRSVRDIIAHRVPRPQTMEITGRIPDMTIPFTFGRAEEWLRSDSLGHTPEERAIHRHRLLTALQNLVNEDPAVVQAPPPPRAEDDLGGIEIENEDG